MSDNERRVHNAEQMIKLHTMQPGDSVTINLSVPSDKVDEVMRLIKEYGLESLMTITDITAE